MLKTKKISYPSCFIPNDYTVQNPFCIGASHPQDFALNDCVNCDLYNDKLSPTYEIVNKFIVEVVEKQDEAIRRTIQQIAKDNGNEELIHITLDKHKIIEALQMYESSQKERKTIMKPKQYIDSCSRLEVLQIARDTYGNTNQLMVSIEELNELSCVLAKYPRYEEHSKAVTELRDKVLDEVADVYVVLNHIVNIFELNCTEIDERMDKKVDRLRGWLRKSDSMEQTTIDREV